MRGFYENRTPVTFSTPFQTFGKLSVSFPAVSVPPDVLLNWLEVLTVANLPNEPPEHIRQPLNDQVTALDIMQAVFTRIEAGTRRTRTVFVITVLLNTFITSRLLTGHISWLISSIRKRPIFGAPRHARARRGNAQKCGALPYYMIISSIK